MAMIRSYGMSAFFKQLENFSMANKDNDDITFVPSNSTFLDDDSREKRRNASSLFESTFWQTLGWVHTPLFTELNLRADIPEFRQSAAVSSRKKKANPKLQIEDKVPYGLLPKEVVAEIQRRKFDEQDLKVLLSEKGIETEAILPRIVTYKDRFEILDKEYLEGIPTKPFLALDLFDDSWFYDLYSQEWLSVGNAGGIKKPIPAIALIPEPNTGVAEPTNFDWRAVSVLDYDTEKKLYLVTQENVKNEMWMPRIYLKFDAEEPLYFVKRLQTAVETRHTIEESLRMTYYVEGMPLECAPDCPQHHLDAIYSTVRRNRQLQPKLKWINDEWNKIAEEIKLEYKKTFNSVCYEQIAKQVPSLAKAFSNTGFPFHKRRGKGAKVELNFPFLDRQERFRYYTIYTSPEVVRALTMVQTNILSLQDKSLYILPLNEICAIEKFEALQRTQLQSMTKYVHDRWIQDIANAILHNFKTCGKGQYDLNQKAQPTLKLTKLGKLLTMVRFKMQDVIRFLVIQSLDKFSTMVQTACATVMDLEENFVWDDNLSKDKFGPSEGPIFEVPLEIKGDRLKFAVDINKYASLVRDLFLEGLKVTKNLPRLEKVVMKKMLYNPDDKLETITEKEKQVINWKMNINRGMDKAIIVANAYIKAFIPLLKPFKTDQINYVKQFARRKVNCDQLKQIIEMHNDEKIKLKYSIPSFLDIGPFRLMTSTVRTAAIKKHEQLAEAVLGYFYEKLNQFMETIKDEFLVLQDRIKQPTGNIEDLLDKKQWCRTVPKKIEKLSADVNRLRSDLKLLSTFQKNMEDEDFVTFWQVQEFPQLTMKMLESRILTFDEERKEHKDHLASDIQQLQLNLEQLKEEVALLNEYSDLENAQAIATEIRRIRKNVVKYDEQAQLYKKRGKLLGQPHTEYPEIDQMSKALIPSENFWLSAAEFYKYNERDIADLVSMDSKQLKEAIEEVDRNLQTALSHFKEKVHPEIHHSIALVLQDLKDFIDSKLSKVL